MDQTLILRLIESAFDSHIRGEINLDGWSSEAIIKGKENFLKEVSTLLNLPKQFDPNKERIVCAANKYDFGVGEITILGARHFDSLMHDIIRRLMIPKDGKEKQGFITNKGRFVDRVEAHKIATEADQILRRCGGDDVKLFSENLY
jgi:hypothetical protein